MTTSKASKELRGTARADRLRAVDPMQAVETLPEPPETLSGDGVAAWCRFGAMAIELGTLTRNDIGLLELLARAWSSCIELEALLRRDGLILVSGEVQKAHPAIAALDRSRALAHRLLADLGLTPPGREKISFTKPAAASPFSKFRRKVDQAQQARATGNPFVDA